MLMSDWLASILPPGATPKGHAVVPAHTTPSSATGVTYLHCHSGEARLPYRGFRAAVRLLAAALASTPEPLAPSCSLMHRV